MEEVIRGQEKKEGEKDSDTELTGTAKPRNKEFQGTQKCYLLQVIFVNISLVFIVTNHVDSI